MITIIGREKELEVLDTAFQSNVAEFIAVYCRRRVGKTYLVWVFLNTKMLSEVFPATYWLL